MTSSYQRRLLLFVFAGVCLPGLAQGQSMARSFEELQSRLKPEDVVVVIENSGRETLGRLVEVTPASVAVATLIRGDRSGGGFTWRLGERRSFAVADVALIHRADLSNDTRVLIYAAQGPFQSLQDRLKIGQTAIVLDNTGREIVGTVAELSSSSLVLRNGSVGQRFDAADVAVIKRTGPIWDGAVKGGAIGLLSMLIALSGCSGSTCEKGSLLMLGAGIGAAIGLGFDAAFGPKTVYRSAGQPQRLTVAPVVSKDRQGVAASIRF